MTWTRLSDYAMTSGTYNVSKAFIAGKPKYTLWLLGEPDKIMGIFEAADKAKEAAEK